MLKLSLAKEFDKQINHVTKQMRSHERNRPLSLAKDIPDDIEKFYAELEYPFRDSKTDEPIKEFAPYQKRTVENHRKHKKLLVLKSQ